MRKKQTMVLEDTLSLIQERYGSNLKEIAVERIIVGIFFTGVKLSNGYAGISYTPASDIHRRRESAPSFPRKKRTGFIGVSADEILGREEPDAILRTVKIAVSNALSESLMTKDSYEIIHDLDAVDIVDFRTIKKVAMVGAIGPILKNLKGRRDVEITVLEKKKENLSEDDKTYFAHPEQAFEIIPQCDAVIITGATIANGTIDGLLGMVRPEMKVIVAGPTAGLLPDALFRKGVNVESGVWITQPDKALDMLGEGMTALDLYHECIRKVNVINTEKMRSS